VSAASPQEQVKERPPEAQLVAPLISKIMMLGAGLAGVLALGCSRMGGCDWMGCMWRSAVAMTAVAFFGALVAGPLQDAITPAAKKLPEEEDKAVQTTSPPPNQSA